MVLPELAVMPQKETNTNCGSFSIKKIALFKFIIFVQAITAVFEEMLNNI